jgi:Carboxypeptidase regulatory-like domain
LPRANQSLARVRLKATGTEVTSARYYLFSHSKEADIMGRRLSTCGGLFRPVIVLTAACCVASIAFAQSKPAVLKGRVVDKTSLASISGATVTLVGVGRQAATDTSGRFVFGDLQPGAVVLVIQARSFPSKRVRLDITEDTDRTFDLDSTAAGMELHALAPLAVTADAPAVSYRLQDFERRRRTGRGQYLTELEIRKSTASNLQDLTRGMHGVTLHCGGTTEGGCRIQMLRAPMNCQPDYVVDGRLDNAFGPATPIRDIVALEVYTGPADVPGEFAGRTAGCGVVVVWTRSGPTRRLP